MRFSRTGLVAVAALALAIAGCSSSRFASMDQGPAPAPAPLPPAPSGNVSQSSLPPPSGAQPSQFPAAPAAPANNAQQLAVNAPNISPNSISGVWTATVAGQSCKVAMSQTRYGSAYRAAPLHCPPGLTPLKGWTIRGNQLVLLDDSGSQIGTLYSSAPQHFEGQLSGGTGITLALK